MAAQGAWAIWGQNAAQMGPQAAMQAGPATLAQGQTNASMNAYYQKQYGAFGAAYINAGVNGQALANGQMAYGQLGQQQFAQNNAYNLQMAAVGVQYQGIQIQSAFQTGVGMNAFAGTINPQTGGTFPGIAAGNYGFNVNVPGQGNTSYTSQGGGAWGISDAQRYLGYAQQQASFGYQQQGINLGSQQFYQSMALTQQGFRLSKAQGTEEFQYSQGMAAQQFGFGQTMYQEQSRFTSGRERRLSEMQNQENITVYNSETEQRKKEFDFQKQQWDLQNQQYKLQITQFEQTKQLQQEQLDANKNFFAAQKTLQEESTNLSKAEWVQQIANQKESLGVQAAQIANQKTINDLQNIADANNTDAQNFLNNLNADTFPTLLANLEAFNKDLNNTIGVLGGGDTRSPTVAPQPQSSVHTNSNPTSTSKAIAALASTVSTPNPSKSTVVAPYPVVPAQPAVTQVYVTIGNEQIAGYVTKVVTSQ